MKPNHTDVLVTVIVVNYNAGAWIERCLKSIQDQSHVNFECLVVDNASTDGSREWLEKNVSQNLDNRFRLIAADSNLGFAAGNNLAAKSAKGTWIALLNPDAFARTDWLEELLNAASLSERATMIGSTQFLAGKDNMWDGIGDELHVSGLAYRAGFSVPARPIKPREAFAPCGAGAMYQAKVFHEIGGFDESFFCYHEDVDIGYRMRLLGGICIQSPDAIIDHISSGVSGQASDFAIYYGTRNRVWTFLNNTPRLLMPLLLPMHVGVNIMMLMWSVRRVNRFSPTWRGIRHGFFKKKKSSVPKIKRVISYSALLKSFAWSPLKVMKRAPVNTREID